MGLALKIMETQYPSESTADESLVSSAAIMGMMAGQLVFGALGDFLGRQLALCCTLLICFAGKLWYLWYETPPGFGGVAHHRRAVGLRRVHAGDGPASAACF